MKMEKIDTNIQTDWLNKWSKNMQEIIKHLSKAQRDEMLKLLVEEQKQTLAENLWDIKIQDVSKEKRDIAIKLILHNLEKSVAWPCLSIEEQEVREKIQNHCGGMNPYEICGLLMRFIQINLDKIGYESCAISSWSSGVWYEIEELVRPLSDDEKNKMVRFLAEKNKETQDYYGEIYGENYHANVRIAKHLLLENMKKNYVTVEKNTEVLWVRWTKIHVNLPAVWKFKWFKFDYFVWNEEINYYTFLESSELIKQSFSHEEIEKLGMAVVEYFREFGIDIKIRTFAGCSYDSDFILELLNFDRHFCLSDSYEGYYWTLHYISRWFERKEFYGYGGEVALLLKISE